MGIKLKRIATFSLSMAAALAAHATPGILRDTENFFSDHAATCPRTVTPDTTAECTKKIKERDAALQRYQQGRKNSGEGEFNFKPHTAPAKPNGLCFTRKATGEVVCPN